MLIRERSASSRFTESASCRDFRRINIEVIEMKNVKSSQILAHYLKKEPKDFVQIDAFLTDGKDCDMPPDEDGDWISYGIRTELMIGSHARVLMPLDANTSAAARQLRKMADIVESRGKKLFSDGSPSADLRVFRDSLDALSLRPELAGKESGARLSAMAEELKAIIAKLDMEKKKANPYFRL